MSLNEYRYDVFEDDDVDPLKRCKTQLLVEECRVYLNQNDLGLLEECLQELADLWRIDD